MKKLYLLTLVPFFILISAHSFGQCTGVTSTIVLADFMVCSGDSIPVGGLAGTSGTGWDYSIYKTDTSFSNKISDTNFVKIGPLDTFLVIFVADSGGCRLIDFPSAMILPLPVVSISPPQAICPGQCVQLTASGGIFYNWSPSTFLSATNISNPVSCPNFNLLYSVVVTDINGCTGIGSVTITIMPFPPISTNTPVPICKGQSIQLNGNSSGGSSYSWIPCGSLSACNIFNPVATPTITTTYTVFSLNSAGCIIADTVTVVVKAVFPSPVLSCSGDTLQVTVNAGYSTYQWYLNNMPISGANAPWYYKSASGIYSVRIKGTNGCEEDFTTVCFVGIDEAKEENFFSIYPNPAYGDFTITFKEEMRNASVSIYDVLGEEVYHTEVSDGTKKDFKVNLQDFSGGIYFIRVLADEKKVYTQRLILD